QSRILDLLDLAIRRRTEDLRGIEFERVAFLLFPSPPLHLELSHHRIEGTPGNESSSLSICRRNGHPRTRGPDLRNPTAHFTGSAKRGCSVDENQSRAQHL